MLVAGCDVSGFSKVLPAMAWAVEATLQDNFRDRPFPPLKQMAEVKLTNLRVFS